MTATILIAPTVEFFAGKQDGFAGVPGVSWHRLTPRESAKGHTGYSREAREPKVGIYVEPVPNGLTRIGLDLWKLNVNFRPSVIERLEQRLIASTNDLSKSQRRYALRHLHVSRTFMEFVVKAEDVEKWKSELSRLLTDPGSFEPL